MRDRFFNRLIVGASVLFLVVLSATTWLQLKASVSYGDPHRDFATYAARRDFRFVGVQSYAIDIPGVPQNTGNQLVQKHGVRVLSGTGDNLVGFRAVWRQREAHKYARTYNALLLARLRSQQSQNLARQE